MERRLQPMQKATLVLILLFGTLTLLLHDERFIKWKPTVLYGAMAIALAVPLALARVAAPRAVQANGTAPQGTERPLRAINLRDPAGFHVEERAVEREDTSVIAHGRHHRRKKPHRAFGAERRARQISQIGRTSHDAALRQIALGGTFAEASTFAPQALDILRGSFVRANRTDRIGSPVE